MALERGSGILLHPTSLPGPHGSGDIGHEAERFIEWLQRAGQRYWQVLPLNPTGFGDSPYSTLSAFATNPTLISLWPLAERGWIPREELEHAPAFHDRRIDFAEVGRFRTGLLRRAAAAFFERGEARDRESFAEYRRREARWLEDYALFMALHEHHQGREWSTWEAPLARRDADALRAARERLGDSVRYHLFTQWAFAEQWGHVRRFAARHGVRLVGDLPIFVAYHSADVWARPHLFHLGEDLRPTVVAGVPPDYFSATGQRWGNPLYRWDRMADEGFAWWIDRMRSVLETVDIARIDHFRGFAGYWEIPAEEPTAVNGRWMPGPGAPLFEAMRAALGGLPIIAEDLGVITPDVAELRDRFDFPGMRVLQFAFGNDAQNPFLPHNYTRNSVAYTGTHDNDTTRGWYDTAPEPERHFLRQYTNTPGQAVQWDLMRLASMSVADVTLFPLQDVIGLGSEGRMNRPGVAAGNWDWRFTWDEVPGDAATRLHDFGRLYGRLPKAG